MDAVFKKWGQNANACTQCMMHVQWQQVQKVVVYAKLWVPYSKTAN